MNQLQKVKQAIEAGHKTIQGIFEFAQDIPKPSVRRVLGQGAKKGHFKRLEKGVYTLTTTEGEVRAYVECASAEDALPRLQAKGVLFDMVFLDPAYFSEALIGRNRLKKKYDWFYPQQFAQIMKVIHSMMRTDDSPVYVMLSQATSAQKDMQKYIFGALECGFHLADRGNYQKTFKNGDPVTNVRGEVAKPEGLYIFSRSGALRPGAAEMQLDFNCERPAIKSSYPTQKAESFLTQIIEQSTFENEVTGDFCAGSGKFGKCALALNRIVYLIEKLESAVEDFIIPNLQPYIL